MSVTHASLVGQPLADYFRRAAGASSCVVAAFDSTLQLRGDDGTLWSITTKDNAGAHRIVAPSLPGWRVGARLSVGGSAIVSGADDIRWSADALWDPRPRPRRLSAAERQAVVKQMATALSGWLCLHPDAGAMLADVEGVVGEALAQQTDRGALESELPAVARRLIGRGAGLTPAGDDVLQAWLVTLYTGDEADRRLFRAMASAISPCLADTTPISRMFLSEALRGWACGPLKALLDVLPDVPEVIVRELFGVGATSGAAYVLGVLLGLSNRLPKSDVKTSEISQISEVCSSKGDCT